MDAVALLAKSELRRHRGALIVLALLVAVVCAAVFTAAAGARRTSGVLDRFLDAQGDVDLTLVVSWPMIATDADRVTALAGQMARVGGVDDVVVAQSVLPRIEGGEEYVMFTGPDARYLAALDAPTVDGRMPTEAATHEVALNEIAARRLGLDVGDVLVLPTYTLDGAQQMWETYAEPPPGSNGPDLRFDVVGIYRDAASLEVDGAPAGVLSPDTRSYLGDVAATDVHFEIRGDLGVIDFEQLGTILEDATPDAWFFWNAQADTAAPLRSSFDAIAVGLWLFASVALGAGLIALAQVISRQVGQSGATTAVLTALGMRLRAVALGIAVPSALATAVGVVLGAATAVLLSPLFPFSTPGRAELDRGVRPDWPVLVVGSVLVVAVLSVWALATGWRQVRPDTVPTRHQWIGGFTLRRTLPVAAGIGCSRVLAPRRGRAGTKPVSAIMGAILGIAGVVAIAVFSVSYRTTVDNPDRFGWAWDAMPFVWSDDSRPVATALADDDRVAGVGLAYCGAAAIDGVSVANTCAVNVLSGVLTLTVVRGRSPTSPGEVAIGERTLEAQDIEIGETVAVTGDAGVDTPFVVVGTVVVPDPSAPGEGLILTMSGLQDLHGGDDADLVDLDQNLALKYPPDVDARELEAELAADYPMDFASDDAHPLLPQSLSQLERVRPTLFALAGFLGLLGAVGLAHYMLMSIGRHRRDSAILKALGFVRRQTRGVVAAQGFTVALIGVALGVPLGVLVGRWIWIATVDHIGIVDTPTIPWTTGAVIIGAALVGSVAISLLPGWLAARRRPAEALRAE